MKKLVLAASAVLLLAAPGLSLAQDDHHHEGGRSGGAPEARGAPQGRPAGPPQGGAPQGGAPQGGRPQGFVGAQQQGGRSQGFAQPPGGGFRPQGFAGGQPQERQFQGAPTQSGRPQGFAGGQPGASYRDGQGGRGGYAQAGGFDRGRAGAQPFGYGGHQYFRYRAAPYRFPGGAYGWADHSWRRGEWLPSVFITSSYFINDWYDFGLWQPDYGYEWIRVGADAVLINLADGQVVDVVPGIYYY